MELGVERDKTEMEGKKNKKEKGAGKENRKGDGIEGNEEKEGKEMKREEKQSQGRGGKEWTEGQAAETKTVASSTLNFSLIGRYHLKNYIK